MLENRKQLSISLTEPVLFLRSSDPSGRHPDPNDPPAIVRGVLTLNVVKPIGISSIEVELSGTVTTCYSDGVAAHYTDIQEKNKIYCSTVTVFRADHASLGKRFTSGAPSFLAQDATNDSDHLINLACSGSSPRRRSERLRSVSIPPDLGPTPPYSPRPLSPNQVQSGISSADMLEELGQALRDNLEVYHDGSFEPRPRPSRPHSIAFCHSNSTVHSPASTIPNEPLLQESRSPPSAGDASFPSSTEEPSAILLQRLSQPRSLSCPRGDDPDFPNPSPARSRFRLSLHNVFGAVKEAASRTPSSSRGIAASEERERGRTSVRAAANGYGRESTRANEDVHGTGSRQPPKANTCPGYERHLLGLGRVLGLERDSEGEKDSLQRSKDRDDWKEFPSGTYSYPISFLLPCDLPPTFSTPHGSLDYTIKAVAHRPGTFTSKLSCQVPLLVVAAPSAGAGEGGLPGDPGPLNIGKEWEGKLAYSLDLSSRLFLLGSQRRLGATAGDAVCANTESSVVEEVRAEAAYGTAALNLTLLPLEKVKIWRLNVAVDQRISYFDGQQKVLRGEDRRRVGLLDVQDKCLTEELGLAGGESKRKNQNTYVPIPLLPTPISPDRSPLLQYISPSAEPSILAGPGPYTISTSIGLPHCGDRGLRFSMKHKASYVKVEHSLRLVMRVETVGDESTKEAKKFDVTVQIPITILSCRCVPEQQTLPVYSLATEDCLVCPCQPSSVGAESPQEHEAEHPVISNAQTPSWESEDGVGHLHCQGDEQGPSHERSRSSSRVRSATHAHSRGQRHDQSYLVTATLTSTPQSSRPPSPLARYERLVSGLESEVGEAPPSYESISVHDV